MEFLTKHYTKPKMDYVEEAVEFVRENFKNRELSVFVAFSGGKDSICLAEIMRLSRVPYQLYYSFTGIDPPQVVRHIRRNYPDCVFCKPEMNFWEGIRQRKRPPSIVIRWCCQVLKKDPGKQIPHTQQVDAIRSEESGNRAKYGRMNQIKDITHFYPIYDWKRWQVWDFIENQNLSYPEVYDWGFDRVGCVICPFHSGRWAVGHNMYRKYWPKMFQKFEKEVKHLWESKKSEGCVMAHSSAEEYLFYWYRDSMSPFFKGSKVNITDFFNIRRVQN